MKTLRLLTHTATLSVVLAVFPLLGGVAPRYAHYPATPPANVIDLPGEATESLVNQVATVITMESPRYPLSRAKKLARLIVTESLKADLDPLLTAAIVMTESSFQTKTVSSKGAIGLMQVKPSTARDLMSSNLDLDSGLDLTDPALNLQVGIAYLSLMRERFGDLELALTAYNMGPARMIRHQKRGLPVGVDYSRRILARYLNYKGFQETQSS